jgi:O-succinylbenzoate synthase
VLVELHGGWGEIAPPPHVQRPNLAKEAQNPQFDNRVRCGHNTAQADAMAKAMGKSVAQFLYEELGAPKPRQSVQVNALLTKDEGIVAEAQEEWNLGIRTFKIKVGTGNDEARVAAVREAFPQAAIRLDPNDGWKDPAAALERYEPYQIEYVEDPGILNGPIPIAADCEATDVVAISKLIATGADAIILKPQRLGGPTATVEAITLCKDAGIPCTITNSLETSVGVHASLQLASLAPDVAHGLATSRFLAKDVAAPPIIADGRMTISGTGIGVEPRL